MNDRRLPPGRQPYDVLNGLRIGALAGVVPGAVLTALLELGVWPLVGGAVVGAVVGGWHERRSLQEARRSLRGE